MSLPGSLPCQAESAPGTEPDELEIHGPAGSLDSVALDAEVTVRRRLD